MTNTTTQIKRPWRTTVRSVFQAAVSLAAGAPLIYEAITTQDSSTATGAGAIVLGASAAITRVMALPIVEAFLRRYVPFLAADVDDD